MNQAEIVEQFERELSWPDDRLLSWAAEVISVPNAGPADSFVLHAPLELMARAALLPLVHRAHRSHARERIVWLVTEYQANDLLGAPPSIADVAGPDEVMENLLHPIGTTDLGEVDRYATWLASTCSANEMRRLLGPFVAPSLAAAAHGSIALYLLGRTPAVGNSVVRGVLREIGRQPPVTIATDYLARGDRPLLDALLEVPRLGTTEPLKILPMVQNGTAVAADLLADVSSDAVSAKRSLSRIAAWSMLQDDPESAPYGWSHTLTIPQAVMSIGLDPRVAVAVAASQVIGFRASMGTRPLDPGSLLLEPEHRGVETLATLASVHFDAHLAKYTLACFDAASSDPEMSALYMCAASYLASWWSSQPDDGFFDQSSLSLAQQR